MKRNAAVREGLGFDDVLLVPQDSAVKPLDVSTKTHLTRTIELGLPFLSAARDNVTESSMAIALARLGGMGIIHDNMPLGKQVEEVRRVKRAEGEIVLNPITVSPESSVAEAMDLMATYKISGLPVIEQPSQKVVGIITKRDIRFFEDYAKPVSELMTKQVVTVKGKVEQSVARQLLHRNRIEKLVVVDEQGRCTGLMTVSDIDKLSRHVNAARDAQGRLRVAAAVAVGKDAHDRAAAMADAGLDAVVIDAAHGQARETVATVSRIRQERSTDVQVIAGNVATVEGARSLIDAGADAIKVGVGGACCAFGRVPAGIGVPQISAIIAVAEQCALNNIPVIAEGGLMEAAAVAKALGAGASAVVLGALLAGTDEAPGEVVFHEGRAYKAVNPAADAQRRPAFSSLAQDVYRAGGGAVDTRVPYRGQVARLLNHITEELKAVMAYTGSEDVSMLRENAEFVRVT